VTIKGSNSQGVSDNAIKVGIVAPISGALSFLGEAQVDGIRSYLEDVNARGGVNGRRFQVITVDDQFEPSLEATAIRRLVQQDKVFATFSNLGDSAAPFVTSKGVPNFVAGWTPPAFSSKYPTTYPVNFNTVDYVNIEAYQLKEILKLPIQSTALMYDSQNLPINAWVDYMKRGWEHFGIAVKSIDSFNLSDADCTQLVLKMQRLNIDYWALGQTAGWPICQQAMARQGYSPPLGRGGPYTPTSQFVGQAGAAAKGIYGQNAGVQIRINRGEPYPWSPDGRAPEVDHFVDTIKKYAPQSADYRNVENIWTQMYWVAAKLLTVAISKQTDAITWDGVNRWIQAQDNWVSGLISPHSFRPNCKTGSEAAWMFQWELDEKNQLVQTSWKPYGGPVKLPLKAKEAIVPGAGECYSTAMADAKV
jgi:ABC-type branched-subunit amino acid transport system substrate-binding protein